MTRTVTFATAVQAALFECEMKGQLSDGTWENTYPHDHWKAWCDAQVQVGREVGVDFYAIKDNYNFTRPDMLECIGNRMLNIARYAAKYGYEAAQKRHADWSIPFRWDTLPEGMVDESFTMQDMKRELRAMKVAVRTYKPGKLL